MRRLPWRADKRACGHIFRLLLLVATGVALVVGKPSVWGQGLTIDLLSNGNTPDTAVWGPRNIGPGGPFNTLDLHHRVASGDWNNDGQVDVVWGCPGSDLGGTNTGSVYVKYGPLSTMAKRDLSLASDYNVRFDGAASGNHFLGFTILLADVNGDNVVDLVMGAPRSSLGGTFAGSVYIVFGGATWANGGYNLSDTVNFNVRIDGEATNNDGGAEIVAGKFDADQYGDLAIASTLADFNATTNSGSVYFIRGGPTAFGTGKGQVVTLTNTANYALRIDGEADNAAIGRAMAAGDVNGDGQDDLVIGGRVADVGLTDNGAIYVRYGPLPTGPGLSQRLATGANYDIRIAGQYTTGALGNAFAIADVNNDTKKDLLAGQYLGDDGGTDRGSVFVWYGGAGSLLAVGAVTNYNTGTATQWNIRFDGLVDSDQFGQGLVAGDITGDGIADFAIGAPFTDNNGRTNSGTVYVFKGPRAEVGTGNTVNLTFGGYYALFDGSLASANVGAGLFIAPGDGNAGDDLQIFTDQIDDTSTDQNRWRVVQGGVAFPTGNFDLLTPPATVSTIEGPVTEGETRVGAVYSVDAGDVNGDGVPDLVVGSPGADFTGSNAGSVYVMFGPIGSGTIDLQAVTPNIRYDGEAANHALGTSVLVADITNDGYKDVIIGADGTTIVGSGTGSVYIVNGGPTIATGVRPLSVTANRTLRIDGDAGGAGNLTMNFGRAMAVGDMNNDGKLDLAVTAPNADKNAKTDSGSVYLFLGPVTSGFNTLSVGLATTYTVRWDGDTTNMAIGDSLAFGNVNETVAPKIDDLVIGCAVMDVTAANTGSVFLIAGATNIATVGAQNRLLEFGGALTSARNRFDGNSTNDQLGKDVAVGDVDGDGVGDLLLGSFGDALNGTASGSVYLLLGGTRLPAAGVKVLNALADFAARFQGETANQSLGSTVALGDITRDGRADIFLGAPVADSLGRIDAGSLYCVKSGGAAPTGEVVLTIVNNFSWRLDGRVAGDGFTRALKLADVDGDGALDLLVGADSGDTSAGINVGTVSIFITGAPAPSLVSPAAAAAVGNTPALDWNDVSTAVGGYEVQVDDDANFGSANFSTSTSSATASAATVSPALAEGVWNWRVRSVDLLRTPGAWSAARTFTVDVTAPAQAPALLSPADAASVATRTPTLDWDDPPDTTAFLVEVDATSNAFGNVVYSTVSAPIATSQTVTSTLAEGTHYWRVRGRDAAGNLGAYSAVRSFTVDVTGPDAPAPSAPATGATLTDNTPDFSWSAATGATDYVLEVDDDAAFASVNFTTTTATLTSAAAPALADGAWYWRLKSRDALQNVGAAGTVRAFTIDTTPPAPPTLTSPASGTATASNLPALDWSDAVDAASYRVQVSSGSAFSAPETNVTLTVSAYTLASALADGTWYWRVASRDAAGNESAFTAAFSFVVDTVGPAAPASLVPNGTVFNTSSITLDWADVAGATVYDAQVDDDPAFLTPNFAATPTASLSVTATLADGLWYWRARARDAGPTAGAFSAVARFQIDTAAPAAPVLTGTTPTSPSSVTQPVVRGTAEPLAAITLFEGATEVGAAVTGASGQFSVAVSGALAPGDHSFTARATDAAGNAGALSTAIVYRVNVPAAEVPAPVLATPLDLALFTTDSIPLTWGAVTGAGSYRYEIAEDATFANPVVSRETTAVTATVTTLTDSRTYYWRVTAIILGTPGTPSMSRRFAVNRAAYTLVMPEAAGVVAPDGFPATATVNPKENPEAVMLRFVLANPADGAVTINSVTVRKLGTGVVGRVGSVRLYLDADRDGALDATDLALTAAKTFATGQTTLTFEGLGLGLAKADVLPVLVVCRFTDPTAASSPLAAPDAEAGANAAAEAPAEPRLLRASLAPSSPSADGAGGVAALMLMALGFGACFFRAFPRGRRREAAVALVLLFTLAVGGCGGVVGPG
ncbi:MAG: FG-GAP repeat protein, partial [Planctomycetes bacterium]|nr:FG-GAP repeat protein [Planctomycetota bacterium]